MQHDNNMSLTSFRRINHQWVTAPRCYLTSTIQRWYWTSSFRFSCISSNLTNYFITAERIASEGFWQLNTAYNKGALLTHLPDCKCLPNLNIILTFNNIANITGNMFWLRTMQGTVKKPFYLLLDLNLSSVWRNCIILSIEREVATQKESSVLITGVKEYWEFLVKQTF
jgi:hypothetical protein